MVDGFPKDGYSLFSLGMFLTGLYRRGTLSHYVCGAESDHESIATFPLQNLEAQKEATERATAESHAMSLESSSLRSQVAVLTEQQSLLHNALQEKVDMLQALQSNQVWCRDI